MKHLWIALLFFTAVSYSQIGIVIDTDVSVPRIENPCMSKGTDSFGNKLPKVAEVNGRESKEELQEVMNLNSFLLGVSISKNQGGIVLYKEKEQMAYIRGENGEIRVIFYR